MKEQIVEALMMDHYTALHSFKFKTWVLCHKPATLEEAIGLMEAYTLAEAGMYLIPQSWKKKRKSGETETGGTQGHLVDKDQIKGSRSWDRRNWKKRAERSHQLAQQHSCADDLKV